MTQRTLGLNNMMVKKTLYINKQKNNIEDYIKDGLIITAATAGISTDPLTS